MALCFNHSDREATARCAVCGKSICEDCVVRDKESTFCSVACREKAALSSGRADGVLAEKSRTNASTLVRKLIYFFVLAAAIAAAWFFYGKHKDTVDQKLKSTAVKAEKKASTFLKETKKSIPTSSQIKRQKENLVK